MKYEKAKAEVISFDEVDIFLATSGQLAAMEKNISGCTDFSGISSNGTFSCPGFTGNNQAQVGPWLEDGFYFVFAQSTTCNAYWYCSSFK